MYKFNCIKIIKISSYTLSRKKLLTMQWRCGPSLGAIAVICKIGHFTFKYQSVKYMEYSGKEHNILDKMFMKDSM